MIPIHTDTIKAEMDNLTPTDYREMTEQQAAVWDGLTAAQKDKALGL